MDSNKKKFIRKEKNTCENESGPELREVRSSAPTCNPGRERFPVFLPTVFFVSSFCTLIYSVLYADMHASVLMSW